MHIEPTILDKNGKGMLPDLLFQSSNGTLIADVKRITSDNVETVKGHLEELTKYQQAFTYSGTTINPEVALLCPMNIANTLAKQKVTVPVFGYNIDEEILIAPVAGRINNNSISSFLSSELRIRLNTQQTTSYRILKSEPPLPYIAEIVYSNLWNNRYDFGKDTFTASRTSVNRLVKTLYPPFLKSKSGDDIEQLLPSRVKKALDFLEEIGWIQQEGDDDVIVYVNKGRRMLDLRKHLIEALAKIKAREESKRHRRLRRKKSQITDTVPTRITDFLK